jgi:predicted Zn-dependent protease
VFRLLRQLHLPGLLTGLSLLCQCATPPPPATPSHPPAVQAAGPARWDRVTTNLAAAVPADDQDEAVRWRFSIRDAAGINALSWPDGRVEINRGILPFVRSDAELAAVLTHEMAHVFHRHHRLQIAESWTTLLAGAALGVVLGQQGNDPLTSAAGASGAILTVNVTALAARRRAREFEADATSLDLLRRAGYPPQAAVGFWERYARARTATGQRNGRWWQAHPPDTERVRRLQQRAAAR